MMVLPQIKKLSDPIIIYEYFSKKIKQEFTKNNQKYIVIPTLTPSQFTNDEFSYKYTLFGKTSIIALTNFPGCNKIPPLV